jgi:guanylate cyclase
VIETLSRIGWAPDDPVELRLRKLLLVALALMVLPASIIWGAIYWAAGERGAALLPWLYAAGSIASLTIFHLTRRFGLLRLTQLGLVLLVPWLLTLALGGFRPSSGVVLWSFIAPLGAIAFDGPRPARWWFVAYAVLLVIAQPLADAIRPVPATLPDALIVGFVALNIAAVSLVTFVLLFVFALQREEAQLRADGLLLNILPPEIAERLKVDRRRIADQFDETSILFADVVGFTPMSALLPPAEVVNLLDELFTEFDEVVDRNGCEKIKTIGDSYMVAAGVPRPRADHARAIASTALEIRDIVARRANGGVDPLRVRIGISSGPVVAGVIGRRKFTYDLWGDTVNTASRMESHGTPGRIQIDEATFVALRDTFECEPRGLVEIKGKGAVQTWYLNGPKAVSNGV